MRIPPLPPPAVPLTAEQMRRRVVGDRPADVTAPITISPYQPSWAVRYRAAAAQFLRHVLLRDWLRTHEADRDRYATRKFEAAAEHPLSMPNYVTAKAGVIVDILRAAGCR